MDEDDDYEIINDKNGNKNDDNYLCIYGRMVKFYNDFIVLVIILMGL